MRRTAFIATALAGAVLSGTAGAAVAADTGWSSLEDLGFSVPSDAQIAKSVRHYSVKGSVTSFATEDASGAGTSLELSADLLFEVDKADLTPTAVRKIGELLAKAPKGAAVAVVGHTDSTGTPAHNKDLSTRRAEAVAAAIREARPDLKLSASGVGEAEPAVVEAGDDIALDRRLNRRVTVSWGR